MSSPKITISAAARNMISSIEEFEQMTGRTSSKVLEAITRLVTRPGARRVDGYENTYYAIDQRYRVVFEKNGEDIIVKSVAHPRQDWRPDQ